jgi:MFS family permease
VQVVALQGPPAVLNYIGKDLNNPAAQTWVPNSLSLVQAVLSPIMSSASDTFQARKLLLVGSAIVSFVGAAIAPGSGNIYRLIVAQILIGVGFASVSLAYAVPSEILPRKWRPSKLQFLPVSCCMLDADTYCPSGASPH